MAENIRLRNSRSIAGAGEKREVESNRHLNSESRYLLVHDQHTAVCRKLSRLSPVPKVPGPISPSTMPLFSRSIFIILPRRVYLDQTTESGADLNVALVRYTSNERILACLHAYQKISYIQEGEKNKKHDIRNRGKH